MGSIPIGAYNNIFSKFNKSRIFSVIHPKSKLSQNRPTTRTILGLLPWPGCLKTG